MYIANYYTVHIVKLIITRKVFIYRINVEKYKKRLTKTNSRRQVKDNKLVNKGNLRRKRIKYKNQIKGSLGNQFLHINISLSSSTILEHGGF